MIWMWESSPQFFFPCTHRQGFEKVEWTVHLQRCSTVHPHSQIVAHLQFKPWSHTDTWLSTTGSEGSRIPEIQSWVHELDGSTARRRPESSTQRSILFFVDAFPGWFRVIFKRNWLPLQFDKDCRHLFVYCVARVDSAPIPRNDCNHIYVQFCKMREYFQIKNPSFIIKNYCHVSHIKAKM